MSIINSDSVGCVLLSWSAVVFVYGFDSVWRLPLARDEYCVLCSWFPGNDFSGRQWRLGNLRTTVGKNFSNNNGFAGIGCRTDGMLQRVGELDHSAWPRPDAKWNSVDFSFLISEILYCVQCWCRWFLGLYAIRASPVWFLWWMGISTCDRVGCASHLDTQL